MNTLLRRGWHLGLATAALVTMGSAALPVRADDASSQAVAVLDFNDSKLKEVAANAQINLSDMLTTVMSNGTGLKVIDKEAVARVKVKDTAWQQSGFADPKTALNFAKELNVHFVIVGSVSQASQEERESMGITKTKYTVGVEVKAMDDKTGQIVASATGSGDITSTKIQDAEGVDVAQDTNVQGKWVKAARKAIDQAGQDLSKKLLNLK